MLKMSGLDVLFVAAGNHSAGKASDLIEGTAKTFTLYLNQAAKATETITLSLSALGDKFKAILGDSVVDANGAVITLAEGQTQVSFALVQQGEVTIDASMQFSATYAGTDQTVTSNAWSVNLHDAGAIAQTMNGDQRAKLIGLETDTHIQPGDPLYNTYKWSATSWATDGTLTGGVTDLNFSDVITGTAGNDKLTGAGGNDALSGGAGNDDIDGGVGDDLIGGGAGSDNIKGGDGNDYINSSATLNVSQRLRPSDSWSPPAGQVIKTQGAGWGIYVDTQNGSPITLWSGSDNPAGTDGDNVDGGAGNDNIIASGGDDRVQGGLGDDQLDGMGGNDVLEGGDGADTIQGDGLVKTGYMNTVAAQDNGADFLDGGLGDDKLTGGGGADVVYGGAGNDQMWGDASGLTSDAGYLAVAYHGADYLDGEDGNDTSVVDMRRKNTTFSIAFYARPAGIAATFKPKNDGFETQKRQLQCHWKCSRANLAQARSMRLAGHKGLGRLMDRAWMNLGYRFLKCLIARPDAGAIRPRPHCCRQSDSNRASIATIQRGVQRA